MRDWHAFVRERLKLPGLTFERESRVVRELAAQLEDFYEDARARGASDDEADAHACQQIEDWNRMARDVWQADRQHARPRFDRTIEPMLERLAGPTPAHVNGRSGGLSVLANALRDARYSIRQLIQSPGFAAVAMLTLALGIGASTAIFSVVNAVVLRPLAYPEPEALVRVHEIVPKFGRFAVAPAVFLDWRQQSTVFERIAAFNSTGASLATDSGPQRLTGGLVSWDAFELLRVNPMLGRTFRQDEDAPGKDDVILLSHAVWQQRFGGDPGVLGRTVTLNGAPVTIIGIMPAGFTFVGQAEFWRPLALNTANASRGGHYLAVIARLKRGITVERAGAEMKAIAERLALQYPANSANESAEVIGLHAQVVETIQPALMTLLAAVAVLILIACANVANLLLVRATVRSKEIAIRTALGAGRGRLILQMLCESTILALGGGILGLLLAYFSIKPIQLLSAGSIPRAAGITIDGTVLTFAFAVSVVTGLLFGLVPALQASRSTIGSVLKEGGRSSTAASGRWLRNGLLIGEVAMSIVLLVVSALLLRSFARLTHVDPGFRPESVLAFRVALPNATYPQDPHRVAFFDRLIERMDALPQVLSTGLTNTLPMRGDYLLSFAVKGRPPAKPNEEPSANYRVISPRYFEAMGIPLIRGRAFTPRDSQKAPAVAIVDQSFVNRHFPNEDPIGQSIDIGNGGDGAAAVVGVVGEVRQASLDATPFPTMYVPHSQDTFSAMWVVTKTRDDPAALAALARQTVQEIDSALPAFAMTPLATVVSDSVAERRFSMLLLTAFASIALFLAAVGLYGVVSYTVNQRTQEIGLRMAIGAQRSDVMRLVVGGGMRLAIVGVVIGIAAALGVAEFVGTMLFDVTPFDPASYIATSFVLMAVAALACFVPARRAMRVDPIVALRSE